MKRAPIKTRVKAASIDVLLGIGVGGAGLCVGSTLYRLWSTTKEALGLGRVEDEESDRRRVARHRKRDSAEAASFGLTPGWRYAWAVAFSNVAVGDRQRRTPGARRYSLRRVDASTMGAVSVRSAVIGYWFRWVSGQIGDSVLGFGWKPLRDRRRAFEPQLSAIKRRYRDDPEGRTRAIAEFERTFGIRFWPEVGWRFAGRIAWRIGRASFARTGRTDYDRVTGTCVIVEE